MGVAIILMVVVLFLIIAGFVYVTLEIKSIKAKDEPRSDSMQGDNIPEMRLKKLQNVSTRILEHLQQLQRGGENIQRELEGMKQKLQNSTHSTTKLQNASTKMLEHLQQLQRGGENIQRELEGMKQKLQNSTHSTTKLQNASTKMIEHLQQLQRGQEEVKQELQKYWNPSSKKHPATTRPTANDTCSICGDCVCLPVERNNQTHYCDCKRFAPKKDCLAFYQAGYKVDGIYMIKPVSHLSLPVYCDQTTQGGGWTVFQRRVDGSVSFERNWLEYKNGFGALHGEFWLGNANLHILTNKRTHLRIDMEDWLDVRVYANFSNFKVKHESDQYQLQVGGYSGTAGNVAKHDWNGMKFTTYDRDNDKFYENCAARFSGGWWHNDCHSNSLNGRYFTYRQAVPFGIGITWLGFHNNYLYSLKYTEMKLKRYL